MEPSRLPAPDAGHRDGDFSRGAGIAYQCASALWFGRGCASRSCKQPERVIVRVRDCNGSGMPADLCGKSATPGLGVGINGMRERLRQFGGELVVSRAEPGTLVEARVPIWPGNLERVESARCGRSAILSVNRLAGAIAAHGEMSRKMPAKRSNLRLRLDLKNLFLRDRDSLLSESACEPNHNQCPW